MSGAKDLEKLHERGERVSVFWPGGPYDFVLEFSYAEPSRMSGWEDWLTIHGVCVRPEGPQHRMGRAFFVRPVEGGYELLPKKD